jgi:hypothetical protein
MWLCTPRKGPISWSALLPPVICIEGGTQKGSGCTGTWRKHQFGLYRAVVTDVSKKISATEKGGTHIGTESPLSRQKAQ